ARPANVPPLKLSNSKTPCKVSVTGIVCGEPEEPDEVTVMLALYTPSASPEVLTDTVTVLGATPEVEERVNQLAWLEAVQLTVPKAGVAMERFWVAGLPCAWNAENDRLVGETARVGGAIVKVTGMMTGELLAPAALKEIVAEYEPCERPEIFTE